MEKITKTVFVTKFALTKGVFEITAQVNIKENYAVGKLPGSTYDSYYHKSDYFDTMEDAIKNANDRITKKIKSLKIQIEKLEKKKF